MSFYLRKRAFDNRFVSTPSLPARPRTDNGAQRMRGKRPLPSPDNSSDSTDMPAKKPRTDEPPSKSSVLSYTEDVDRHTYEYQEVSSYAGRSLKDDGVGVRPLVK